MIVPDNDSIGEPKIFEKDGIDLTLTDKFIEKYSNIKLSKRIGVIEYER